MILPPANEVCEGYVFTDVCLSTGGMSVTHPMARPPWTDTPLGRHHLPSACWDTVNKRAVRIPLECILVTILITGYSPFGNPVNSRRFLCDFTVKSDQGYFLQWKPYTGEMHNYCANSRNFYSVSTVHF